jgi:hypothetical protein
MIQLYWIPFWFLEQYQANIGHGTQDKIINSLLNAAQVFTPHHEQLQCLLFAGFIESEAIPFLVNGRLRLFI